MSVSGLESLNLQGTWKIDPAHSEVGFVVKHYMISKVRGRFDIFEGTIAIGDDPFQSTVDVTVDMASVNTNMKIRDADLRSPNFFDTETFPRMTFKSTAARPESDHFILEGDLTIREITKRVSLTFEANGVTQDPHGGTRAAFSATGRINRMDFGVSYQGPIPGGGVAVSEAVDIAIEVEAILQ